MPTEPTLFDWVTVVSAGLAAIVPAVLFVFEWRGRRRADERVRKLEQNREMERDRAQADLVHFWIEEFPGERLQLWWVNSSSMPVTDVAIKAEVFGTVEGELQDPAGRLRPHQAIWRLGVVPPTSAVNTSLDQLPREVTDDPDLMNGAWISEGCSLAEARFTDASGRPWSRVFGANGATTLKGLTQREW